MTHNARDYRMTLLAGALCAAVAATWMPYPDVHAVSSCAVLAPATIAGGRVVSATTVDADSFVPPAPRAGNDDDALAARAHRAFCRVTAMLTPTTDSSISVEVWLPLSEWNGKFMAVGNGAFAGSVPYPAMIVALNRGYAVSGTDTGHQGSGAEFAYRHPEKLADFAWRAVHEMTVFAKRTTTTYFERAPSASYWNGCSGGGRQGLKEAQMFPADYDGIIAGDPGLDWISRASQTVKLLQRTDDPAARLLAADRQLLHRAVVTACDANDGLTDGLVSDPVRCHFDPATLRCGAGAPAGSCLSDRQVDTARLMYASMRHPATHREIHALLPASELGWTERGWTASAQSSGRDQFRYLVHKDPEWTPVRFRGRSDVALAEEADHGLIDARSLNLTPFLSRGGKLIQYHGWSDAQISPLNSVAYYDQVLGALGASTVRASYRLFMAPGMGHCRGGEGPNSFDAVSALEAWVEQQQAPDRIVASHSSNGRVDRTRPLCPYPQTAAYTGVGSIDDAASFACR